PADLTAVVRICFVCLGNICRSPTAEAVMRHLVAAEGLGGAIAIASAGTGDWHVGEPRDRRGQAGGRGAGGPAGGAAPRAPGGGTGVQFTAADFDRFDYVIAMDRSNRDDLVRLARDDGDRAKVSLLRSFDPDAPTDADVPDPYYGGPRGFEDVFDICERACRG